MNKYTIYFQEKEVVVIGDYMRNEGDQWVIYSQKGEGNQKVVKTLALIPKGNLITIESIK